MRTTLKIVAAVYGVVLVTTFTVAHADDTTRHALEQQIQAATSTPRPLPAPPAAGWCFDYIGVWGYNGVRTCPAPPPPPPGTCTGPAGLARLLVSNIQYGAYVYPGAPTRYNADVTDWNNIWGHRNSTDAMLTWPGVAGSGPSLAQFGRHNFLAAHFRTTSATNLYGNFAYPESIPGPTIDLKISTACGDFSADTTNPGCVVTNAPSGGQVVMNWTFVPGNLVKCALLPNTDYYFNVKMHDPASTVDCAATNPMCPLELALTFGQ